MKIRLIKDEKTMTNEILDLKRKTLELRNLTISENSSLLYQVYDEELTRKLKEYIEH